jgi:peroxiredoxin Q/BCP
MGHVRSAFDEYEKRDAKVVAIAGQDPGKVKEYLEKNEYPFRILVDEDRSVIKEYGVYVRVNFESLNGARPAEFVLSPEGMIRYIYIGSLQRDFPDDVEIFTAIDSINSMLARKR